MPESDPRKATRRSGKAAVEAMEIADAEAQKATGNHAGTTGSAPTVVEPTSPQVRPSGAGGARTHDRRIMSPVVDVPLGAVWCLLVLVRAGAGGTEGSPGAVICRHVSGSPLEVPLERSTVRRQRYLRVGSMFATVLIVGPRSLLVGD